LKTTARRSKEVKEVKEVKEDNKLRQQ